MFLKPALLSLYFVIIISICNAQGNLFKDGFGVEVSPFIGYVLKHNPKFTLPLPTLSTGADVNLLWKTTGEKEWQQRRRYPVIGLGFTYTNYGIDSVYGRCFSIYPNVTIPIITLKNFEWTVRIGDGLAYVTNHYSRTAPIDTLNVAVGSPVNDYASFATDIRYKIDNHWDIQVGGNFSHISNASFHLPNLGVNLYGYHIGVRYFPVSSSPKHFVRDIKPLKNRWEASFRLTMSLNQPSPGLGPNYPVYLATGFISKRWIGKNKFFAGIDYSYHESIYSFLRNNIIDQGTEAQNSYKVAVLGGNEFLLGRVGIVLQLGYYLNKAYLMQEPYYEKLGINLYLMQKEHGFVKEIFICTFMKAHLAVAELAEFGFGMGF